MVSSLMAEARELVRAVRDAGYTVVIGGSGHYKILDQHGQVITTIAASPSDRRFWKQTVTDLKRLGVLDEDPRKVGQRKRSSRAPVISERQTAVSVRLKHTIRSIPIPDLARHMYQLRLAQSEDSARLLLLRLSASSKTVGETVLDKVDQLLDDVTEVPAAPTTTEEKVPRNQSGRLTPAPISLQQRVRKNLAALRMQYDIPVRRGRTFGHGQLTLAGKMTLMYLAHIGREDLAHYSEGTKRQDPNGTNIGARFRDVVQGHAVWSSTKEIATKFCEMWESGFADNFLLTKPAGRGEYELTWKEPQEDLLEIPQDVIDEVLSEDVTPVEVDVLPEPPTVGVIVREPARNGVAEEALLRLVALAAQNGNIDEAVQAGMALKEGM